MKTSLVFEICKWNLILKSVKFSYDLLLNWAVTSTKEIDVGCLWHSLGTYLGITTKVVNRCLPTMNEVHIYLFHCM
jgi:hypothetical protein